MFFDAGTYLVTSTITIPPDTRIVGEAWSVIMGGGPAFEDSRNPRVVVRVGNPGDQGVMEISDMIFATRGPGELLYCPHRLPLKGWLYCLAGGAIVVEWNIHDPPGRQGVAGMWDSHIRYVRQVVSSFHNRSL